MTILSLYASGYPPYYRRDKTRSCPYRRKGGCDEKEVSALMYRQVHGTYDPQDPRKAWWPRTADFYAEAIKHAKKPKGVASTRQLSNAIKGNSKNKISRAILFAHGIKGEIQFGSGQHLGVKNVKSLSNLSHYFTDSGTLDIFACNTGQSQLFLQSIANQLGIVVRGFKTGVKWELKWSGTTPHRKITQRGIFTGLPQPNITKTPQKKQASVSGSLGKISPSRGTRQVQSFGAESLGALAKVSNRGSIGLKPNARG